MNFVSGVSINSLQFALQAGPLVLTTAMQDMPGLSLTLERAGDYLVVCVVDFVPQTQDAGATLSAQLVVSGVARPNNVILSPPNGLTRVTVSQQWLVKGAVGTAIKMQASKSLGVGASSTSTHTSLSALWVSP
jgi:hypothetical protein